MKRCDGRRPVRHFDSHIARANTASSIMSVPIPLLTPHLDRVDCEFLRERDIAFDVLRLDCMHPQLHGNKWFKLKYNVQFIQENSIKTVLSFGGAWSNHLYALAAAGRHFGFRTIGIVRGEIVEPLNPVLRFARERGMELVAVSRSDYRLREEPEFIESLQEKFGEFMLLPEGGSNALAVRGCADIAEHLDWQGATRPGYLGLACGTGTTLAGVVSGLTAHSQQPMPSVLGVAVLNAPGYLEREVRRWLPGGAATRWTILEQYHAGGYAKSSPELAAFLQEFAAYSAIPLEPVYTGKLIYGLFDQIRTGGIPAGSHVIALHTGGIVSQ